LVTTAVASISAGASSSKGAGNSFSFRSLSMRASTEALSIVT
jgi:hypothetical protein